MQALAHALAVVIPFAPFASISQDSRGGRARLRRSDLMMHRCLAAVLICSPGIALAHHSFAMFDMNKDVTLSGTVLQFQWASPHSWLDIEARDSAGKPVRWSLEMGAPNALYRRGWRQFSLKPGYKVSTILHPLRDGRFGGSLVSVTLPDGSQLLGSGGSASPAPAAGKAP